MGQLIYQTCRVMTWVGSFVLTLIAIVSVLSIIGRSLTSIGLGPISGDFELVEAGIAFVVFCFMPWCHLKNGHAIVDMLWNAYPEKVQKFLSILSDALMLSVWIILVWRMIVMMDEYRGYGEVTYILQIPIWMNYAITLPPAVIGCIAYAWRFLEQIGVVKEPKIQNDNFSED